jgi:Protein of unknown function (DUF3574)
MIMKLKQCPSVFCLLLVISLILSLTWGAPTALAPTRAIEPLSAQKFCENQLHEKLFLRTELLFGLSKQDHTSVTEREFQNFIDQTVTPLFPDGLTLLGAKGQFRNNQKLVIKEDAKILLLLYPFEQENQRKIEQIRQAYRTQFQQESVLRVDNRSCISF